LAGLKRDFYSFGHYTVTLFLLSIASSSTAFNTAAGQDKHYFAFGVVTFVFSFQLVGWYVLSGAYKAPYKLLIIPQGAVCTLWYLWAPGII